MILSWEICFICQNQLEKIKGEIMPRILIVGTAPYDRNCQSRAFESYFHGIEAKELAQIFSYQYRPPKGHCEKLYQITDAMMLKRFFNKKAGSGKAYKIEELNENDGIGKNIEYGDSVRKQSQLIKKLYQFGKKDTPIKYLLRGILWKKNSWCTDKLNMWLDEFNPECVFLSFSDDFFIPRIALYVAERFNVPIISSIADDYYFNDRRSFSPFYYIYRKKYKALIDKILTRKDSSAIYIGDRIKEKYNSYFGLDGITLYLTSDIQNKEFRPIRKEKPKVSYYGNIRLGRNKSLMEIGNALQTIDSNYYLDVYSNEKDASYISEMRCANGVRFHGAIPYEEVQQGLVDSDLLIVVESFDPNDVITVKYSISTKVSDSLATGTQVFAYGDCDCGAIDYLLSTKAVPVCTDRSQLVPMLKEILDNAEMQKTYYYKALEITAANHRVEKNAIAFQRLVDVVVHGSMLNG